MHRTTRSLLAAACLAALTACGGTTATQGSAAPQAPQASPVPSPSQPPSSPAAAPTAKGPKLKNADVSQLKSYALDMGVPITLTTGLDDGPTRFLDARPDGTVDLSGTAATESSRMKLLPAKVRKRTEENQNTVVIQAAPALAAAGPETCVTKVGATALEMQPCRPGAADQAWRLVPAGDSGLFELFNGETAINYEAGKLVKEGQTAFETTALEP